MAEARTIRQLREAIRQVEQAVERVHMAPAVSLGPCLDWYLRKARLALRQAEIHAAKADDPRLGPLEPLRPQLRGPRPSTTPKRRRFRCPVCFREELLHEYQLVGKHAHFEDGRHRHAGALCTGRFELVARLRRSIG